jgi:choline kinase
MLEVNGVRLIDRALSSLYEIHVSRVVLVVGYQSQNLKEYVGDNYKGMPVIYVDNPVYDKTNNIYSLYLAKDYLVQEDSILLESDLIFEPSVLKKLEKKKKDIQTVKKKADPVSKREKNTQVL